MSIRVRLIIWHSTVFAVSLIGFALVVWLGTRAAVGNDIDTWLRLQADGLARFIKEETHGTERGCSHRGSPGILERAAQRQRDSTVRSGWSTPPLEAGGRLGLVGKQPSTFVSDESRLRAMSGRVTIGNQEFRFTLWRSLDSTEAALGDLRLVLILMVPAFLVVSVVGGWLLSRRALRPIDDVTEAARRISLQDLSSSLPVPRHGDELQRLCEAWNEMLRRLDDSARQLRQFTADASHELRTPVALIRTTAELTLRKDRTPEQYQEALRGIQKDAEKLTELVRTSWTWRGPMPANPKFSLAASGSSRTGFRDSVSGRIHRVAKQPESGRALAQTRTASYRRSRRVAPPSACPAGECHQIHPGSGQGIDAGRRHLG